MTSLVLAGSPFSWFHELGSFLQKEFLCKGIEKRITTGSPAEEKDLS